jgi:saccharopine dehydrogenase (NAD+, L-lysine forming)
MVGMPRLWLRAEVRPTEHRTPIVPADAALIVADGIQLTVEESAHRAFPDSDYAAAGCRIVPGGSWVDAPRDSFIVGLKELPVAPASLVHRHVYFGHVYKGQHGGKELLRRFMAGGGQLLDIEYLVDDDGRRLAAFGYWAGYVGAALAVLHYEQRLGVPLRPMSRSAIDEQLHRSPGHHKPRVLIIGALGRCGRGARDALAAAAISPTCWDMEETRVLDRAALLDHDVLVNTVLATRPIPPFLVHDDLDNEHRRLALITDVTCDVSSACNALPIYERCTSWAAPAHELRAGHRPLQIIAIDNLPALMPEEASMAFSADLRPLLTSLGSQAAPWQRCVQAFHDACRYVAAEEEFADV